MSEQVSATHGPVEDDAIKRQDRSDLQARGQAWPDPESADAETGAVWAPEGRFAGALEDWPAIELRSELARKLDRTAFPATRSHLLDVLDAQEAGQRLLDLVSSLPDGASFGSLGDLVRGLGLPMEERPGGQGSERGDLPARALFGPQ